MKSIYIAFFLIYATKSFSQEVRHAITSNWVVVNSKKQDFNFEVSTNLKVEPKIDVSYILSNKIALFGSYNWIYWRNRRHTFLKGLFGGPGYDFVENKNSGYSLGVGFLNTFSIGKFKNTNIILGFESQKLNLVEYSPTYPNKRDIINEKYYKIFLQFNISKSIDKFSFGYGLKISYFNITDLQNKIYYDDDTDLKTIQLQKNNLILFSFNVNTEYTLSKNRLLVLTFQYGVAGALDNFGENINREGFWGIMNKIGLKYTFHKKTKKRLLPTTVSK